MKRMISLVLAVCLVLALQAPALASEGGITKVNTYTGQFTDVPDSKWYADAVRIVYEYGMMTGVSDTLFNPTGTLSMAEAVTLASRLHSLYHGGDGTFPTGKPWYMPCVIYAEENGILSDDTVTDYSRPATRQEFALLISNALPEEVLPEINKIEDGEIPDVSYHPQMLGVLALENAGVLELNDNLLMLEMVFQQGLDKAERISTSEEFEAVYRLYRAGILSRNDASGTFTPRANIDRASVAAIVSRILEPSLRKTLHLQKPSAQLVPLEKLANLSSLRKNASDAELAQAYEAARPIVEPLLGLPRDSQLCGIALALRVLTDASIDYSTEEAHYNDPYGFFVLHVASCAGCTRATGLCLNMLGIPYEHVNENQYTHQWTRVNVDGTYWICDAYGLYCAPEVEPYRHPVVTD